MQPHRSSKSLEENLLTSENLLQDKISNIKKLDFKNKLEWK